MQFIKFSAEAKSPAGYLIMDIVYPVEHLFGTRHKDESYCDKLDDIFMVFICTSKEMHDSGFYNDRKYVSHKNRYADYRLNINYEAFLDASPEHRINMIWTRVVDIINMVHKKVPSLEANKLTSDLYECFTELYPNCKQIQL